MFDSEKFYTKEYDVNYYEQNVRGTLKESSLLNFLQDIATLSAESLGFGPSFVFSNNYAWVVLRYHIELYSEIKNYGSIVIRTEPRGISKLYAFRDFEIYSRNNELLGKIISTWTLIDMETRKILPLKRVLPFMPEYEKRDFDLEYNQINPIEDVVYKKTFDVRFDDIDVNKHTNNCNYIIWALETLPNDFRCNHSPKVIDIKYRKEIGMGGTVICETQLEGDISIHKIMNSIDSDELSTIRIEWA